MTEKKAVQYSFSSGKGITMELGPEGIEMLGEPVTSKPEKDEEDE